MNLPRIVATLTLLSLLAGMFLTGCNTWKGAGKDVQKTGEAMEGD